MARIHLRRLTGGRAGARRAMMMLVLFFPLATPRASAEGTSSTPPSIPIDPVYVVTEDSSGQDGHGLIERPEGVYLYERATGKLLALLPRLDSATLLSDIEGQPLDHGAQGRELPPSVRRMESWPFFLPEAPAGPTAVGDLNGDGKLEIVVALIDGQILVLDQDGSALPGWPRTLDGPIRHGVTLADVNHDGRTEVLVVTEAGNAHVLTGTGGEEFAGWPVCLESLRPGEQIWAPPVVADLDGLGDLEVILIGTDGTMDAFSLAGAQLDGWPVRYEKGAAPNAPSCFAAPAIADLEGDGELEIVAALNNGLVTATNANGVPALGWPRPLPGQVRAGFGPVAVTNLDGRGGLDVVVATDRGFPGTAKMVAFRHNGTLLPGWPVELRQPVNGGVAVADLDGDGSPELLAATLGGDGEIVVLRADGTNFPGWPRRFRAVSFESGVVVADLDGQPGLEIAALGTASEYDSQARLFVLASDGELAPGFPLAFEGADAFQGGLTLADFDSDGHQDIILALGGIPRIAILRSAGTAGEATTPWPRSSRGPERVARAPRVERSPGPRLPPDRDPTPESVLRLDELPSSLDPNTTISFVLNRTAEVRLRVLDIQGSPVRTSLEGRFPKGLYAIDWDGLDESSEAMPSGVYFFELAVDGAVRTKRLLSLLR